MSSSLDRIRVLDLSRVLAGPVATQILGDLGAEVIKVERPSTGDDTRSWGPPFLKDKDGNETSESAYYLSCNRNKKSVTIDITTKEGQEIIRSLAAKSDILIHNFKVGGLEKYGLGYEQLRASHPHLIYVAISGFGQNGPLASEPGYDLMAQAMGGLMAHTGNAGDEPMKAGVAVVDVMTGLYAVIGTLSALRSRDKTGRGQMVDLALLDVTLSAMTNIAQFYLTSGMPPKRFGNAHSTIVPYQAFQTKDGYIALAVGNDHQFQKFAAHLGKSEWGGDPRFAKNESRVKNREILVPMIANLMLEKNSDEWVSAFRDIDIPAGAVQSIDQVFEMDQIKSRGMEIDMPHPLSPSPIKLVGSPLHMSENPVSYRLPPPVMGADTEEVLKEIIGLSPHDLADLKTKKVI